MHVALVARPGRRPCRPRRAPARGRRRSRSGSGRSKAIESPVCPLARLRAVERVGLRPRSSGPRTCASSRAGRARAGGGSSRPILPHRVSLRAMRAIDAAHLGSEQVICGWELDGVLVDPGPESTRDRAARGARRRLRAARAPAHAHPLRPRRRHRRARAPLARPAGLRARARRAAPDRPRAARGERRAAVRRRGRPRARCGARSCRCPRRTCTVLSGGETVLGEFRVEYTPGPRLAPRRLPARAERHGVRRRRRRRADPARRLRDRPDAAAGHRRRGLGRARSTSSRAGSRRRSR